jgi:hypothetical protein
MSNSVTVTIPMSVITQLKSYAEDAWDDVEFSELRENIEMDGNSTDTFEAGFNQGRAEIASWILAIL